jgi:hypothetical protein
MSKNNERRCKVCGQNKPLSDFEPNAWNPKNKDVDPFIRTCFECRKLNKYVALPGNINLEKLRDKGKTIERAYGITLKEYENLYIKQNGMCAICHHPEPVKSRLFLAVDHDHKTGKVRGLLCSKCNMAIGSFGDSVEYLLSAIRYLKNNSQR